jgi:hypothetical protein
MEKNKKNRPTKAEVVTVDPTETKVAEAEVRMCECGCGGHPAGKKSRYLPGHDSKAKSKANPKAVRVCQCGCGEVTKGGRFRPGHDARYHAARKSEEKVRMAEEMREAACSVLFSMAA